MERGSANHECEGNVLHDALAVRGPCVDAIGEMRVTRISHTPFIHCSPACHIPVIPVAQPLHHFVGVLHQGSSQHGHRRRMPARTARIRAACWTDEAPECPGSASRPCARLDPPLRSMIAAVMCACSVFTPATTSRGPQRPSVLCLLEPFLNEIEQHDAAVMRAA